MTNFDIDPLLRLQDTLQGGPATQALQDVLEQIPTLLAAVSERDIALQALWDVRSTLGFDQDGDTSPDATIAAMGLDQFITLVLREAREQRAEYDTEWAGSVPSSSRALRHEQYLRQRLGRVHGRADFAKLFGPDDLLWALDHIHHLRSGGGLTLASYFTQHAQLQAALGRKGSWYHSLTAAFFEIAEAAEHLPYREWRTADQRPPTQDEILQALPEIADAIGALVRTLVNWQITAPQFEAAMATHLATKWARIESGQDSLPPPGPTVAVVLAGPGDDVRLQWRQLVSSDHVFADAIDDTDEVIMVPTYGAILAETVTSKSAFLTRPPGQSLTDFVTQHLPRPPD